jgi:argininosuccinate lyase
MFVVIGTTTVDLFITGLEQMPHWGGDEFTTSNLAFCDQPLTMGLGGNGANSAYVLATLGAPTALCSATGQDKLGDIVTGWLTERGVGLQAFVRRPQAATATTTIIADSSLNRVCFYHPGALHNYGHHDIPTQLLVEAKVLLISSYPILPLFRAAGFAHILAMARQTGAITAVDIGPAIGRPAELAEIKPLLTAVDYLIANKYELSVCLGTEHVADGVGQLWQEGANTVVVKRGKEGASLYARNQEIDAPGFAVAERSTVGAGDSFNAGFLYGVQQGWDVAQALDFGNATAALVVSAARGVLGCPTPAQVEAFLKRKT